MIEMIRTQYNYIQSGISKYTYEKEIILDSPGYSDWVLIPPDVRNLVITFHPIVLGTGNIETTNDLKNKKKNSTAIPFEWCYGVVSRKVENSLYPIKAVRLLNISGTVRMVVSAG